MVEETLGHYQILEKIGEGGMGAVYKARDMRLDRFVALKVLPQERPARSEEEAQCARRLVHEAKAASALDHPNIITIYDRGSEAGIDYIAMEYVQGETLAAHIARNRLQISEVLKLAVQIAEALSTAHAAGILHRDLKPTNVMVTESGSVKVLDFGLAKQAIAFGRAESNQTETLTTKDGMILGTVAYMSPEQAEGKKLDFRSDIFSFGALLYEMLTGNPPFGGETQAATMADILRAEPTPATAVRQDVPADFEKLIERCLRKDPARRVQTMADLKVILDDLLDESKTCPAPVISGYRSRFARWGSLILVLVFLAGLTGFWLTRRRPPSGLSALPLTGNQGLEGQPALSPDGNQVAYSWNGAKEDNFDIYVKLIGPGAPLRLTTDPAPDILPAWSPDGRWLAFMRQRSEELFEIVLIPALGGSERKISEAFMRIGGRPVWTRDSQHLIVAGRPTSQEPNGLSTISISTGEMRMLTVPPFAAIGGDGQPALSPDGRTLAFIRGPSGASLDIFTVPFPMGGQLLGTPTRVTFDSRAQWPTWSPDGHELIYSSYVLGQSALLRVPADGSRKPERLIGIGEGGIGLAISPAAHRLVYVRQSVDENIWKIRVADGEAEPATRLIASTLRDFEPRFSPDGQKIVYASDRSGHTEVWTAGTDGSNQVQLTDLKSSLTAGPRWSPDGRQIVFLSVIRGQLELFTIPADGGATRRLTDNPAHDTAPSWSHDGEWIYFGSNRSGEFQIWKMSAAGGDAIQLTSKGGFAALESCDGKYLYYARRPSGGGIWRIPTAGGEEMQVIPGIDLWGNFAVSARGIYFVPPEKGGIRYFDFSSRRTREVAKIDKPLQFGLSVTADGQFIVYTQTDRETDELLVVEDFR